MSTKPLYSREEIAAAVHRLAGDIQARLGDQEPVMALALLNGALWFAADLLRELPPCYMLETARVSSYGAGTESCGSLRWETPLPDCAGKRVLVLDDILDTGVTLEAVADCLRRQGAAEVYTAVLVNQHTRRSRRVEPDFAAFDMQCGFLLGYGMDLDGRFRNLPYLAEWQPENDGLPGSAPCDSIGQA